MCALENWDNGPIAARAWFAVMADEQVFQQRVNFPVLVVT
jgi:hypothetical protein